MKSPGIIRAAQLAAEDGCAIQGKMFSGAVADSALQYDKLQHSRGFVAHIPCQHNIAHHTTV